MIAPVRGIRDATYYSALGKVRALCAKRLVIAYISKYDRRVGLVAFGVDHADSFVFFFVLRQRQIRSSRQLALLSTYMQFRVYAGSAFVLVILTRVQYETEDCLES